MNTHVVTRQLPVGERIYQPGDEVDASEWKHSRLLVEQRYLKPLDGARDERQSTAPVEMEGFYSRVVDGVIERLRTSGELAQLIQPNGRDKRMGRKDTDGNARN
jgi:hypothetical protein